MGGGARLSDPRVSVLHYYSHLQNGDRLLLMWEKKKKKKHEKKTLQSSWNSTQQKVDSNLSGGGGKVERGTVGGSF